MHIRTTRHIRKEPRVKRPHRSCQGQCLADYALYIALVAMSTIAVIQLQSGVLLSVFGMVTGSP